jgi:zona occludens toxin
MITLITGLPGSGKSLFTLKTVNDLAVKENRQVYYFGIPELTLNWILMDSPESWVDLPTGSIFVIDECQSTFRPRGNGSAVPRHVSEFETHRHKGLDAFLITQHPMLIDGNLRRLVGRHFHVVRFYGFAKSKIHEFNQVRENVDKSLKNSIENHFLYPKEVYSWYKSADLHTVKKRIPMRLVMMFLLPMLLIGIFYYGYTTMKKVTSYPDLTQPKNVLSANGNINQPAQIQPQKLNYIQARTSIVPDLPMSAPIYEKVVEPVTAPYPAACIYSKFKGCKCFTQQGTTYKTDQLTCLNVVNNGFFIDFNNEPKPKENNQNPPMHMQVSQNETLVRNPDVDVQPYKLSD